MSPINFREIKQILRGVLNIYVFLGFLLGDFLSTQYSGMILYGVWVLAFVLLVLIYLRGAVGCFPSPVERGRVGRGFILFLITFLLASFYTEGTIQLHKPSSTLKSYDNQVVVLKGQVVGIPQVKNKTTQFDFQTAEGKIRVFWRNSSFPVHAGDTFDAPIRLRRPSFLINPGMDERRIWLNQKIVASGPILGPVQFRQSTWTLDRGREWLHHKAEKAGRGLKTWPLIEALVLGIKKDIPPEHFQAFRATGTSHLMAISGLHIGLLAVLGLFIGQTLIRFLFPHRLHQIPNKLMGGGVALLFAILYSALAGFSIPTQRALIMILVVFGSLFLRLKWPPSKILCVAGLVILFLDPLSVLSPGFWLSFVAVGWLIYAKERTASWWKTQLALLLGLMPFTVWYFQSFSWISPLANAIAIPWTSFWVVPSAFLGFVTLPFDETLARLCFQIANQGLELLLAFLALCTKLPSPLIHWKASFFACLLAFVGTWLLCIPLKVPGRWLGLFLWLPFFFPAKDIIGHQEAKMVLLDVGQGLAVSIETAHHHLLYDLGPKNRVLVPYLEGKRLSHLDAVIVSHFDADHAGGLPAITERWPIGQRFSSDPTHPWQSEFCRKGLRWEWDGVIFEFLHPDEPVLTKKRNNLSCVLKMQAGEHSLLLTGDIEQAVELKLLKAGAPLKSSVLLVPHHGSRTSSSEAFIKAVDPSIALIASGRYNPYRHPRPEILARYALEGIPVWDTAQVGAVALSFKKQRSLEIQHFSGGKLENLWYNWK